MLNILTQLPLQSILNFKAISKSWNATLSSPSFATAHSLSSSPFSPTFPLFVRKSNPAIWKYTAVPAPVDCPYSKVFGLGYDPTSRSFKILLNCSVRSWRWYLFSSLTRPMECTGSTCYGVFCSSPNLAAFDLNTKSWDSIPPQEGLSYPCGKLGLRPHSCGCLLKTQMWGDRVCVFNINHDLELKMWVLNREMMNWELVPSKGLDAVILVADTFFISRYRDTMYHSTSKRGFTKIIDIAYNVRSHQLTRFDGKTFSFAFNLVPYKTTLLSWDA
ncbi:hypothetical protein AMTRI_Chr01g128150 [Amborella trichopoda]